MTKNYGLICVVLTGNNPMVGATVACAVSVEEALTCYPLLAQSGRVKTRLHYYEL